MALEGACAPGLTCLSVLSSHQSFNACEGCLMPSLIRLEEGWTECGDLRCAY